MVTHDQVQKEIDRRQRLWFHLSTNDGVVELIGTQQVGGYEPDGMPTFLTQLTITGPHGDGRVLASDRLLEHLVDLVENFLQRPQPPVNVRVELVAPQAPPPPLQLHEQVEETPETEHYDNQDGKQAIKRRMLAGSR